GESCVRSEKDQMINSLPRIGKLLKIEDDSRVMASNILMFRKIVEEKTLATNLQSRSCLYESAVSVY
ncbi:unnamed protein product, partial [Brassica oleracea]